MPYSCLYQIFPMFKTITPLISNLVEKAEKITKKQEMTNNKFSFYDVNRNLYEVTKNDNFIIHFWDLDQQLCLDEIKDLKEFFGS